MRLAWEEFLLWAEDNQEARTTIEAFVDKVNSMVCDVNQQEFDDLLYSPLLAKLMTLWSDFLEHLCHNNGELSTYWMSYIDVVESVVLGLLRASRKGKWCLHLSAIHAWCFSYEKVNYARYLSAYFAEMTNLPEKNPCVYEAFKAGQFSVQMSSNNPFGRIPVTRPLKSQ